MAPLLSFQLIGKTRLAIGLLKAITLVKSFTFCYSLPLFGNQTKVK